jgi:hypothetical protein
MKFRFLALVPAALVALALPAFAQTAATPAVGAEGTDHSKFVGHFAIGYLGTSQIPLGATASATGGSFSGSVTAPAIGGRYWLNEKMGIDAGLGFAFATGSSEAKRGNTTTSNDAAAPFGVLLHGGVPLALAQGKHYTFEVIPELNVGFASQTIKGQNNAADTTLSGFRLDLGARAGAEVHFGFIGVPELALQGTVGLQFATQSAKTANGDNSDSVSATGLSTTVQAAPWAIFTNNISALYYF